MMKCSLGPAFVILAFLAFAGSLQLVPAKADTSGTFAGTVAYINRTHIGVKAGKATRDYLVPSDFDNVRTRSGKTKVAYSSIKTGDFVTVSYQQSVLFGSTRATEIIVGSQFGLPYAITPLPLPTASPS
jgi:hypothetical protein